MNVLSHPVVLEMFDRNVPFEVKDGNVVVHGFSKSGVAILQLDGDRLNALTRYGQVDRIKSFDDLVQLAWQWYTAYNSRQPFDSVSDIWETHFVRLGLFLV
jgi:hypothetical protein